MSDASSENGDGVRFEPLFSADQVLTICKRIFQAGDKAQMAKDLRNIHISYDQFQTKYPNICKDETEFEALRIIAMEANPGALEKMAKAVKRGAVVV